MGRGASIGAALALVARANGGGAPGSTRRHCGRAAEAEGCRGIGPRHSRSHAARSAAPWLGTVERRIGRRVRVVRAAFSYRSATCVAVCLVAALIAAPCGERLHAQPANPPFD